MKNTDLMIVLHHLITIRELQVVEVAHLGVKDQDTLKKAQRIHTLRKLPDQYTIPKTVILHTNLRLHQQGAINVSSP